MREYKPEILNIKAPVPEGYKPGVGRSGPFSCKRCHLVHVNGKQVLTMPNGEIIPSVTAIQSESDVDNITMVTMTLFVNVSEIEQGEES